MKLAQLVGVYVLYEFYIYICTYMPLKTYVFVNITHVGLWVVYTLIEVWDVCTYMII